MLGPNPKKAATPSTANSFTSSSGSDSSSTGDGLMVKAIDDIFRYVESSENPQEFRVSLPCFVFALGNSSATGIYVEIVYWHMVKAFINSRHGGGSNKKCARNLCRKLFGLEKGGFWIDRNAKTNINFSVNFLLVFVSIRRSFSLLGPLEADVTVSED